MASENEDKPTPPSSNPNPPSPDPEAIRAAKEAARAEERAKLQASLEHHKSAADREKAERESAQAAAKKAQQDAEAALARVKELEESKLTKDEKTERRITELTEAVTSLRSTLEAQQAAHKAELERVADSAVTHVRLSDLKAELARQTAGLNLDPDLMPTVSPEDTPETLTEKVNRAKTIQERISGKRAEAIAEEQRSEAERHLPPPISPNATGAQPSSQGQVTVPTDAKGRRRIASLNPAEYRALREKLLADAAASAPDGNPYVRR